MKTISHLVVLCYSLYLFSSSCLVDCEEQSDDETRIFLPGNLYHYNYATTLHVQPSSVTQEKVGLIHYKIHCQVVVESFQIRDTDSAGAAVSELLKLSLSNLSILNLLNENSESNYVIQQDFAPIFIERTSFGAIERVHVDSTLKPDWINFLKGVANSFNYRLAEYEGREVDTSGDCQTKYELEGRFLVKRKSSCLNTDLSIEREAWHELLSVEREDSVISNYNFNDLQQLQSMTSSEYHKVQAIIHPEIGSLIRSSQFLTLTRVDNKTRQPMIRTVDQIIKEEAASVTYNDLFLSTTITSKSGTTVEQFETKLQQEMSNLDADKLSTLTSSKSFLKLVAEMRQISHNNDKDELSRLINKPVYSDIKLQLLDVMTACQTGLCFSALMDQLQFDDSESEDIDERILFSISYLTLPTEKSIATFFTKVKMSDFKLDSVKYQAVHTLGTLVGKFGESRAGKYSELIHQISTYLYAELEHCSSSEECSVAYLGAVKNGKFGDSKLLLAMLETNSTTRVKVMALRALSSASHISDSDKIVIDQKLKQLFYHPKYKIDNSVKIQAFDLLFQVDCKVQDLLKLCSLERNNTHLVRLLIDRLKVWESLDWLNGVTPLLNRDPLLNNYHLQSGRTLSTYRNGLLSEGASHALDFELSILSGGSGIIKESNLAVTLMGRSSAVGFLSVNLFASGIDSLVGDAAAEQTAEEEVTAGMVISILGKSLRPVKFFSGQSGLMSAVWHAPSTAVSALQGLLLVMDFQTTIHLQNGLVFTASTEGGLSFDLSGSIEISLWSRNSASLVRSAAGLVIHSSVMLDSEMLNVSLSKTINLQSHLDFKTEVNFGASPLQMCLEMIRPDLRVVKSIESGHHIPGVTQLSRECHQSKVNVAGLSYGFGDLNNRMCRIIKS